MSLNLDLLEDVRVYDSKLTAACPSCRETGGDRKGENLVVFSSGHFKCVRGCTGSEIYALAGAGPGQEFVWPGERRVAGPRRTRFPWTMSPLDADLEKIRALRRWPSIDGLRSLAKRGLLRVGHVFDDGNFAWSWIITDSSKRNAQARRFDGAGWPGIAHAKAKTIPGVPDAAWPIGAADIRPGQTIVACEGQPDFCAVLVLAHDEGLDPEMLAPVCITGAGLAISRDALPRFAGHNVVIPYHHDEHDAGLTAAHRWTAEFYAAGAHNVTLIDLRALVPTAPIKDLADYGALPERPVRLWTTIFQTQTSPESCHYA